MKARWVKRALLLLALVAGLAAGVRADIYSSTIGVRVTFSFAVPDREATAGHSRPAPGKEFTVDWQAHLEPVQGHWGQWQTRLAYLNADNTLTYSRELLADWGPAVLVMQVRLVRQGAGSVLWVYVMHTKKGDKGGVGGEYMLYTSVGIPAHGKVLSYRVAPLQPDTAPPGENFSAYPATLTMVSPSTYQPTAGCIVTDGLAEPE